MTVDVELSAEIRSLAAARGLGNLDWRINDPGPCGWAAVYDLLASSFAFMSERIDPPSSFDAMEVEDLARKADMETVVIAADAGHIIACGFFKQRCNVLYIGKVAVNLDYRRRGILRMIVDTAAIRAYQLNICTLELETRIELAENHRTFAALGFVIVRKTCHPGYDQFTSVVMQRTLRTTLAGC